MDYQLTMEERDTYLYFYVTGKDSLEVSIAFWREIIDTCLKRNYRKALVEEDLEDSTSLGDVYEVITSNMDRDEGRFIKFGFVDRHMDQYDINLFGEMVATNRGINAKVFSTVEEAENWLLS